MNHQRTLLTTLLALAAAAATAAAAPAAAPRYEFHSLRDASGLLHAPSTLLSSRRRRMLAPAAAAAAGADYPGATWLPATAANFTQDDRPVTDPITKIVIHVAEGSAEGAAQWFRNPAAQASAHYAVSSSGAILQSVHERDVAWHAGNWTYNLHSIGIEHSGYTGSTAFPDVEYRASARLAAYLARRYLIVPDRRHVIGHDEVPDPFHPGEWGGASHHTDPGPTWNWARYMAYLRSAARDTYQQLIDGSTAGRISAQSGAARVRYRLATPQAGAYDLMMRWRCGDARAGAARVTMQTVSGPRSGFVYQRRNCASWNYVGSFRLPRGDAWRLSVAAGHGTIAVDGVRLVAMSDPLPPSAPPVTATAGADSITLSWGVASDNVGVGAYEVWLDGRRVWQGPDTSLTVPGLLCGSSHIVSVRARDLVGNYSPRSPRRIAMSPCP